MLSDGPALLKAILADPADDTARLVYADWLDEHESHDWAEFIRLQIEQSRLPMPEMVKKRSGTVFRATPLMLEICKGCEAMESGKCRWHEIEERAWELFRRCRRVSPALDFAMVTLDARRHYECHRRGFVTNLTCEWKAWYDNADEIVAEHPIEKVVLTTVPDGLDDGLSQHMIHLPGRKLKSTRWPKIEFQYVPSFHE